MKKIRTMFMYMLCAIATVSFCSCGGDDHKDDNELGSDFNIVGNWYISQYWGEEKYQETEVWERGGNIIKEIKHPEETHKKWDDSYDYGKNIISFKEDNILGIKTVADVYCKGCTSYILDVNNRKLIFIGEDKRFVHNVSGVSDDIIISCEYEVRYKGWSDYIDGGIRYIRPIGKYTCNLKLKKIN